jgi:hypothetical protein
VWRMEEVLDLYEEPYDALRDPLTVSTSALVPAHRPRERSSAHEARLHRALRFGV